ncbi:unnamed protein product [Cylicostephanus goldi]|uniref:Uncharacterized protein n=1 Tax=Cylicostephanus goldi TaxID=71465 RepID=A0A3P6RJA5_CYLGO|nr:unnamed protein product [Cylicostephanus goldi]
MSRSSSNETYELFIDDYDDYYNEPMVAWPNPCPTPPPSPPYPYAYPYQANPLTDWVPSGVWTPILILGDGILGPLAFPSRMSGPTMGQILCSLPLLAPSLFHLGVF